MDLLLILVVARMMSSLINADVGGLRDELVRGHTVLTSQSPAEKLLTGPAIEEEYLRNSYVEGSPSIKRIIEHLVRFYWMLRGG